jgi:outer membrane protein, heavy metal efflux system
MKYKTLIISIFIMRFSFGQTLDHYLRSVEQNNHRLTALQKWIDAEEAKSKTGIYPENPRLNYNYLFGNHEEIGDQQEIEITQSFRLPGFYTSKAAVQKLNFQQKQIMAEKEKRETLHSARTAYFHMVWLHNMESLLKSQNTDAMKLVSLMKEGFDGGEISKPAYDKARIYAIGIQTGFQKVQSEIVALNQYLEQLNGGIPNDGLTFEYPVGWGLPELDSLMANLSEENPDLILAQIRIQESEMEIKNQRMNSLPSFEAGYKSETIPDQQLQGFHAGITIPLWENSKKVKHARMQSEWTKAGYAQQENEIEAQVKLLYNEIWAHRENYLQTKMVMEDVQVSENSLALLQAGQVSFMEYIKETEMFMEAQAKFLEYQRAYFVGLSLLSTLTER